MPGSDMRIRSRAARAGEPGLTSTLLDPVPEYPTIPAVRSLTVDDVGWEHVTVDWTMPPLPIGAEHYFSGKWAVESDVADRLVTTTTTADVIAPKPLPPNGPFEATLADEPTPTGDYVRLSTGRPIDSGEPAMDSTRDATVDVLPITGWQMDGPGTQVIGTMPARIVAWVPETVTPSYRVEPRNWRDPDTLTWPAVRTGRPWVSVSPGTDRTVCGRTTVAALHRGVVGCQQPGEPVELPRTRPVPDSGPDRHARGVRGASVTYGMPRLADGSTLVGIQFWTPHARTGTWLTEFWDESRKRWITTGPKHNQRRHHPRLDVRQRIPTTSVPAGGTHHRTQLNITRIRLTAVSIPFDSFGAGFSTWIQPPPNRTPGAAHHVDGKFTPRTIIYRPVESRA